MPVSMPQFRFPFTKKAAQPVAPAEEHGPVTEIPAAEEAASPAHHRGKSTSSISITSSRSREVDTNNYKLSVVNDNGEYIPPSPTEKKSFWGRTNSTTSSTKEDVLPDTQDIGFAITRESFDSYRRSFDISAKTPLSDSQRQSLQSSRSSFDALGWGRQSMDSKMSVPNRLPSIDVSESASEEEGEGEFRDVDLNENVPPQKKKGFFGRFSGNHTTTVEEPREEVKTRSRSSTMAWRREHNKDAEELSAMVKGSNHLISV